MVRVVWVVGHVGIGRRHVHHDKVFAVLFHLDDRWAADRLIAGVSEPPFSTRLGCRAGRGGSASKVRDGQAQVDAGQRRWSAGNGRYCWRRGVAGGSHRIDGQKWRRSVPLGQRLLQSRRKELSLLRGSTGRPRAGQRAARTFRP